MIKTHYLKHHPMYEFRDFEPLHIDGYREWLHSRVDYLGEETYPAEISPWEQGSKLGHLFLIFFDTYQRPCVIIIRDDVVGIVAREKELGLFRGEHKGNICSSTMLE